MDHNIKHTSIIIRGLRDFTLAMKPQPTSVDLATRLNNILLSSRTCIRRIFKPWLEQCYFVIFSFFERNLCPLVELGPQQLRGDFIPRCSSLVQGYRFSLSEQKRLVDEVSS